MNNLFDRDSNDREHLLRDYLDALESSGLETQEALLDRAMRLSAETGDASLEMTLWEMNVAVGEELMAQDAAAEATAQNADAAQVLSLAQASFSTPVGATHPEVEMALADAADDAAEEDPPPLTLRDVGARLRADARRVPAKFVPAVRTLAASLETAPGALPIEREHLTERGALSLLGRLGFGNIGPWVARQFHEALLSLQISHEQQLRLTAARRSRRGRPAPRPDAAPPETGAPRQEETP